MKIYVAHSTNCDYVNEIYKPIREDSKLKKHYIVLPHEDENYLHDRAYYNNFDIAICEVSYPSTGLGIELAFLFDSSIPIYCLYKKNSNYSKAVLAVTKNIIEYNDKKDLVEKIKDIVESR